MREMDLKITKLKGKKQHISLNMHNTNVAKKTRTKWSRVCSSQIY